MTINITRYGINVKCFRKDDHSLELWVTLCVNLVVTAMNIYATLYAVMYSSL